MSFFFQAEDGIRDIGVTGVQTCALPISPKFFSYPQAGRPITPSVLPSLPNLRNVTKRRECQKLTHAPQQTKYTGCSALFDYLVGAKQKDSRMVIRTILAVLRFTLTRDHPRSRPRRLCSQSLRAAERTPTPRHGVDQQYKS